MIPKSKVGLLGLAAMMAFGALPYSQRIELEPSSETPKEREARLAKHLPKINKARGLKEFHYGDNTVWAINQRVADKKARKNKWIL